MTTIPLAGCEPQSPSVATYRGHQQIRATESIAVEWPLIGRESYLSRLRRLIVSRERGAAMIVGPPGVGKTSLASACLSEADRTGLATARMAASHSAARLPLGAFAALLPADGGDGRDGDRSSFLRRCCDALVERADGRRLVLFVDDAHLLDEVSATLIHQLVHLDAVFVLLTLRAGEPAPDAVQALWKDELADRLELDGLPAEAIHELLVAVLGGPVERRGAMGTTRGVGSQLAARCQGNALFRELVLGAVATGALAREGNVWQLRRPLTASDRVVELVEVRLAGLSDAERTLLELVALGEPLGPAELSAVADPTSADSLERQRLLTSRIDGRRLEIRLDHPVIGEVLRGRMPATRRCALVRALADAVDANGARRRDDTLTMATWRLDSGGPVPSDLMLSAAQQALERWALPLAERLARASLSAGAGFDACLLLALICRRRGGGAGRGPCH